MTTFLEKIGELPYLKIHKYGGFTKFIFHVFDRCEIPIQAFANVFYGKFIIFQSASPQKN